MYKIAVMGDFESVMGFKALGLDVFAASEPAEAVSLLARLKSENYAIIYITEDLAQHMGEAIARFKDDPLPAIILIPGKSGPLGLGAAQIKDSIERAVGADIIG
jgi:V/A-type H+-transporting ATPase subunit F